MKIKTIIKKCNKRKANKKEVLQYYSYEKWFNNTNLTKEEFLNYYGY